MNIKAVDFEAMYPRDVKAVDFQAMYPRGVKEVCIWKTVIKNNLLGEGTSFDPANLTQSACRCVTCDGQAFDCLSYAI